MSWYMRVSTVPMGGAGGQKRLFSSLELELQVIVNYLTWVLEFSSCPLEDQYVLLINKPSLKPIVCFSEMATEFYNNKDNQNA